MAGPFRGLFQFANQAESYPFLGGGISFMLSQRVTWAHRGAGKHQRQHKVRGAQALGVPRGSGAFSPTLGLAADAPVTAMGHGTRLLWESRVRLPLSGEKPCWGFPPWSGSCIYTLVTWAVADPGIITRPALLGYHGAASRVGEGTALPAMLPPLAPGSLHPAAQPNKEAALGKGGSRWGGNVTSPPVRNQLSDHPIRHPLGVGHWGCRGKWCQQGPKECLRHLEFHG